MFCGCRVQPCPCITILKRVIWCSIVIFLKHHFIRALTLWIIVYIYEKDVFENEMHILVIYKIHFSWCYYIHKWVHAVYLQNNLLFNFDFGNFRIILFASLKYLHLLFLPHHRALKIVDISTTLDLLNFENLEMLSCMAIKIEVLSNEPSNYNSLLKWNLQ